MSLTIAQALRKIKKLKGEIAEAQKRVTDSVCYQAEKVPAFRFGDELKRMEAAQTQLVELEARLAKANASKTIIFEGNKITLAHAVRQLQEIKAMSAMLKELYIRDEVIKSHQQEWNPLTQQHMLTPIEIVWKSDLSEVDRDKKVKELEAKFEALNDLLESANHKTAV